MVMKRPIQKVRGAILVMAAIMLALLIGIAALTVDVGRLFVLHTEMQNAVDSAALSAAVELDGGTDAPDALERAKMAADQEMLNHLSHFSNQDALLEGLPATDFTFYSWIGSNQDSLVPPDPCDPDPDDPDPDNPEKCVVTEPENASYVKIELKPSVGGDPDDDPYVIDLYFLPVLSLFGTDTQETASSRVAAVAGAHYEVCDYPPMIICDPGDLTPGDMIVLKTHQGGAWEQGSFGWLTPNSDPAVDADGVPDPIDVSDFNDKRLLAHRLGSRFGQACSPPIVEVKSGNTGNSAIRQGLNTRFGMYDDFFKSSDYPNFDSLPSAPNVVDYPRDDDQTDATKPDDCELAGLSPPITDGVWDVTECGTTTGNIHPVNPDIQQPSTYSRAVYEKVFYGPGISPPSDVDTRFEYYNWELESPAHSAEIATDANDNIHNDESQCILSGSKYVGANGNQNSCRMLKSEPFDVDPNGFDVPVDDEDEYKRRELFVAVVPNCEDLGNSGPDGKFVNVPEVSGKWMKFFLTERVDKPGGGEGLNVFAEFMEEVTEREDEHFRKVVQLYE